MNFDLEAHLIRQREFSIRTFGPGARTKNVCQHIRKELAEIEAQPRDVMEWVDVIILGFDGALRAGLEPGNLVAEIGYLRPRKNIQSDIRDMLDVCETGDIGAWIPVVELALRGAEDLGWPREAVFHAMLAKQIKNESRQWPDWRGLSEDEAIEHVREVSA